MLFMKWVRAASFMSFLLHLIRLRNAIAINQSSNYSHLHLNWNILTSAVAIKLLFFFCKNVAVQNCYALVRATSIKLQTNWYSQLNLIKLSAGWKLRYSYEYHANQPVPICLPRKFSATGFIQLKTLFLTLNYCQLQFMSL